MMPVVLRGLALLCALSAAASVPAQEDAPRPAEAPRPAATPRPGSVEPASQAETPPAAEPASRPSLIAVVKLEAGEFRIALETERTPLTVANFVELVNRRFYDGLTFYQVIGGTTAEAGCPINKGIAGPGYIFENEIRDDLTHDAPGVVSMANVGRDTNGSRFVIALRPMPQMDGRHTIFGRVISGMDVVNAIREGDVIGSITLTGTPQPPSAAIEKRLQAWRLILDRHHPPRPPAAAAAPQAGATPAPAADAPTDSTGKGP